MSLSLSLAKAPATGTGSNSRPTGECHSVDVRYLHREGYWCSLRWSRAGRETGSIRCAVEGNDRPERMLLYYRQRSGPGAEGEDVHDPVSLEWTACNFGEERPWFVCPGTGRGRRVAILYGPGSTSCVGIATTSPTRASARTGRAGLSAVRRRSGRLCDGS